MTVPPLAAYPATRLRRLRQADWSRRMVRETSLQPSDLIWSMVVHEGEGRIPVASMPGVDRLSVAEAAKAAVAARELGIPCIAIFPHIDGARKDAEGSLAAEEDGVICRAIKAMKAAAPEVGIMCDVALDPFTTHGHDGVLKDGRIVNDATIERLVEQALVQARAGCDILAPSAAKYASAFYGPYRDAIGSGKLGSGDVANPGDKKTYQMDPANSEEAIREVALDIAEGADMVMVKPGMPYLDIARRLVDEFAMPTFAFQVSGEYAMIMAAAQNGWIDEERAILESLGAFKRAGCAGIITYFAPRAARMLRG